MVDGIMLNLNYRHFALFDKGETYKKNPKNNQKTTTTNKPNKQNFKILKKGGGASKKM